MTVKATKVKADEPGRQPVQAVGQVEALVKPTNISTAISTHPTFAPSAKPRG